jgi:hypothetical protein
VENDVENVQNPVETGLAAVAAILFFLPAFQTFAAKPPP